MAFALVQHTSAAITIGTNPNIAYASNVAAGSLLVVGAAEFASALTVTSVANTGTVGALTWSRAVLLSNTAGGSTMVIYWALTGASAGSCTPTVTFSTNASGGEIWVSEWSGAAATTTQDGTGQGSTGTLATINLPTITTTFPNGIVFNYIDSANAQTVHAPWTLLEAPDADDAQYQLNVGPGTYTPSNTQTSGSYGSVTVAIGTPGSTGIPDLIMAPPHR